MGRTTSVDPGLSLLEEGHALRASDDGEGAMRRAVAILEAAEHQLGAAALAAHCLVEAERTTVAGEVATRLVDAYVRRGDLPSAVGAAILAGRAGQSAGPLYRSIAAAFGQASERLGNVSPAPPPLPREVELSSALQKLKGDALLDRADEALRAFLASADPVDAASKVPELPLFSALLPDALERLLGALELRDVGQGQSVVRQGEEGHEAFVVVRGMLDAVRDVHGQRVTLASLGPGAIFGEMALVSEAPRAASVLAVEPTLLLVAQREDLERKAAKEPAVGRELGRFCQARMISNLIRHGAILGAVDPASRQDLVSRFVARTFEADEVLVAQGDESQGLFLIASGSVHVKRADEDGDQLLLASLGPGNVVGEISLVLRRPATANVVAAHQTVALELTRERFQQAIKDHPTMLNELYELATARADETASAVAQEAVDIEDVVML